MNPTRISALLEPFLIHPLSEQQLDQISIYIDLLQRWNARINLTAIRNEEEIVTRHFGESLFLARHVIPSSVDGTARLERTLLSAKPNTAEHSEDSLSIKPCHPERSRSAPYPTSPPAPGIEKADTAHKLTDGGDPQASTGNWVPGTGYCRALDIGSGAGFPALPLKIWSPQIHLTLIESNHKKSAFLKEVSRALTFTNINVITERLETLTQSPRTKSVTPDLIAADVITLRAVEHFESILPQALHLLPEEGTLALLIGTSQLPDLPHPPNLNWFQPIPIPNSDSRILQLARK